MLFFYWRTGVVRIPNEGWREETVAGKMGAGIC